MFKTFVSIYKFLLAIIIFIWIAIFCVCFYFLGTILFSELKWCIPLVMFGLLLGLLTGVYFHIILSIPIFLTQEFDIIKNNIALKKYQNVNDFQKAIAEFIIKFFRFPGINVSGGIFHFKNTKELKINFDELISHPNIGNVDEITKMKLPSGKYAFFIPINLADFKLGFMVLKMEGFVLPISLKLFKDFVNLYLDDQLMYMLNQKEF